MSLFREIPPTAGLPLYARDIASVFFKSNQQDSLEEEFKSYLGASYCAVTYSGTAAFYIILEALKGISSKKTVIIPSFICPLVPLAIKRAGLKVLICDINKDNFDFEISQLKELLIANKDILAIVPVHLAGLPVNFKVIQEIARENKLFIIEDCAQSLGAMYQGKKVGTLGDFSFFSLCRGKGLTIYEGGAIISSPEFISIIDVTRKRIAKDDLLSETLKTLELFGYWLFYRPLFFWFVFRLPQIYWEMRGETEKAFIEYFTVDFPLHKVSKMRKRLGQAVFKRLDQEISEQRQKAADYIAGLKDTPGITLITETGDCRSNYPYLTLVFDEPSKRDRALKTFKGLGLGVAQIYLYAITDYDYLKDILANNNYPNARSIAKRHISLTTSTFLSHGELRSIIERIKKI